MIIVKVETGTNSGDIYNCVIELLDDKQEHSLNEMKEYIRKRNPSALENRNLVNAMLYKMIKNNEIERVRKMTYRIKKIEVLEKADLEEDKIAEKYDDLEQIINKLESTCKDLKKLVKAFTYGLAYEEYIDNQVKYEAERKLDAVIESLKKYQKTRYKKDLK